ncbi:MAG: hypothetical protein VW518_06560, partial [Burkholderiaceae bacterium]
MSDLGDDIEKIEAIADKKFSLGGFRFTPSQLGIVFAAISSVIGALYAGFIMYQKIEEVAGLDLGAYEQKMEVMDAKVQESLDYARDIKNGLRDDILRIEKQADRVEDMVRNTEEKVRMMIDDAEGRFESKREQ